MIASSLTEFLLGALLFCCLTMALVFFVLFARKLLLITGTANLTINQSRIIAVPFGETLNSVLIDNQIYLPSSCGGKGTCGQCLIKVLQGNQPLLPLEREHINDEQATQGFRLACMLRVKGDVSIEVPDNFSSTKEIKCKVIANRLVSTFMTQLVLQPESGEPMEFEAGDYIMLKAPSGEVEFSHFAIPKEYLAEWDKYALRNLKSSVTSSQSRAYSLANAPTTNGCFELLVRIATPPENAPAETPPGAVSSYIFSLKPDDRVSVTGPYGEFHCSDSGSEIIFIGGGAGMAPLRAIIRDQLLNKNCQRLLSFWYGARNQHQLCYQTEFEELAEQFDNFSWYVALSESLDSEHWSGKTGFIHQVVFDEYLSRHPSPQSIDYFLCGPPIMTASVVTMLKGIGVKSERIFIDDFS